MAVLGSGALMLPELTRSKGESAPAQGETLKLVQFNLWENNNDPEGSARWVLEQDPDIITIAEGYEANGGAARLLRERYPYAVTCADPQPCSTMILSKTKPVRRHGLGGGVSDANLSAAHARFAAAPAYRTEQSASDEHQTRHAAQRERAGDDDTMDLRTPRTAHEERCIACRPNAHRMRAVTGARA